MRAAPRPREPVSSAPGGRRSRTRRTTRCSRAARATISQLVALLAEDGETDLGYARVGGLYVPAEPHDLDALERRARARAVDAPEAGRIERLSPTDARALFPPLRRDQPALFVVGRRPCRWTPARRSAAARRGEASNAPHQRVGRTRSPWRACCGRARWRRADRGRARRGRRRGLGAEPARERRRRTRGGTATRPDRASALGWCRHGALARAAAAHKLLSAGL